MIGEPRPSRRGVARVIALAVLAAIVAMSFASFFVARQVIDDQEQRLLAERRAEVAVLLQSAIGGVESSLRVLAGVGASTDAGAESLFVRSAGPLLRGATDAVYAAVKDATGRFTVVSGVGAAAPVDSNLEDERAALADRSLNEGRLVAALADDGMRLVVAVPAVGASAAVALQESRVSTAPVPQSPGSPFGDMRAVVYASEEPDQSHVLLTTESDLQIENGAEQVLDIGAERWLLVVGAREPLVGAFAHRAPWFLLAGGMVTAVLAAAVVETLSRRRAYAEALVDERTGELRRTLAELRETRMFHERLVDSGPGVAARAVFPFERFSYVSPNIERVFGHRVEDGLAPGFLADHVHPDDRQHLETRLRQLDDAEQPQRRLEVRFQRADGEYRWVNIVFVAERVGDLAPDALVCYVFDIDDRRQLEQAQLEAQLVAESANRSKSDFLSRMSHELRTPLNAVIGFAQLLDLDDLTTQQREGVRQIVRGGEHLLDLINEVLDISRIETGRLRLSLEAVRLDDVVNDAIDLVRPLATARGILIPYRLPAECTCHVRGDRQRLKQVLLNLIGNAVKYNRDHGRVEVTCDQTPAGRVRILVADSGPGIAPEKLALVFTPFERLDAANSTIEGTGLGLALARGLAHAMGGELGVDSVVGEGSTFWVELEPAPAPVSGVIAAPEPVTPGEPGHSHTVLYIEDNLSNVRLVERILGHRPRVKPIIAMQGQLGIDLALQHRPDLVLLDLNLPDMEGEEVLGRLRAEPATRGVPIVVVSADATNRQIERLLASGASEYLTKPLDVVKFLATVDTFLGASDETPPAPAATTRSSRPTGRLDDAVLRGLRDLVGPGSGLDELATTFKDESAVRLVSLRAAAAAGDRPAVHDLAHSLKGIAGTFGDVDTMRICTALQEHAATADLVWMRELVDDLAATLEHAYRELDVYLASVNGSS
jgi:PAS domain S-box-containing protein